MKLLRVVLCVLFCLSISTSSLISSTGGTTYTSTGSGPWESMTWNPSGTPGASDDIIIDVGHAVTINSSGITVNSLTIKGTLNTYSNLVTTSAINVTATGTLIVWTTTFAANYGSITPTLDPGSTVEYRNGPSTIKSSFTYQNLSLTYGCNGTTDGDLTVNGNLNVGNNCTLNPAGPSNVVQGTGTLTGWGTVTVNRTTEELDNFSGQYTISNKTIPNLMIQYTGSSLQYVGSSAMSSYNKLAIANGSMSILAMILLLMEH